MPTAVHSTRHPITPRIGLAAGTFLLLFLCCLPGFAQPVFWRFLLSKAERSERQFEYQQAEKYLTEALEAARRLRVEDGDLADILDRLGDVHHKSSDYDKAAARYGEAFRLRTLHFGPDHDSIGVSLQRLGKLARAKQDYTTAYNDFQRALEVQRKALGEVHVDVINVYLDIGELYLAQERHNDADQVLAEALRLRRQGAGPDSEELADTLDQIATLYSYADQHEKARNAQRQALEIRERLWISNDPRLLQAVLDLADAESQRDDKEAAEALHARAFQIADKNFGPTSPQTAQAHSAQGSYFYQQGQLESAEQSFRRAVAIGEKAGASESLANDLNWLAYVLAETERTEEACTLYDRSVEILLKTKSWDDADLVPALYDAAWDHRRHSDFFKAGQLYARILEIQQKLDGYIGLSVANVLEERGEMNVEAEDWQEAARNYERVINIRQRSLGLFSPRLESDLVVLADIYRKQGRNDKVDQIQTHLTWVRFVALLTPTARRVSATLSGRVGPWPVWGILTALAGCALATFVWLLTVLHRRSLRLQTTLGDVSGPDFVIPAGSRELLPEAAYDIEATGANATILGLQAEQPRDTGAGSSPPAQREFSFRAEGGDLFSIWIMNLLRTLLTLGVYYFWAKIRVRRYVYEQTFFDGDPLAFHGTGKEMLRGWLKALPFLAVILWGPTFLPLIWSSPYAEGVAFMAAVVTGLILWPLAQVGARRYRLSRSSWRGIRFSFRGTRSRYFGIFMAGSFLGILTLGLSSPFFSVWEHRFFVTNSYLGNQRFGFRGRDGDLLVQFLLAVFLTPLTLGLYWFWYQAYRERYLWSNTTFDSATFRCTLSGKQLCRLTAGNFFLIVLTLGFAWPWVLVRRARVWLENIHVEGPVDFSSVRQEVLEGDAAAEGFADYLGMDFGI